jgi:hypothetical protein
MAEQIKCAWCQKSGASTWSKPLDKNISYVSKQHFCCLKCQTEYDDRYGIQWNEVKKNSGITPMGYLIIILVILYLIIN